jgi:class 3 adenylate cyclase
MFIDNLLTAISPTLLIPNPEWQREWRKKEYSSFKLTGRLLCFGFAFLYFGHFFLVDLPVGKQPIAWWAFYRFSVTAIALTAGILSFTKWYSRTPLYKVPAFLCVVYTVYMQGQSMGWRADIPWYYVPIFSIFGAYALRMSIVATLAVYFAALAGAWQSFFYHPIETHHMVSASFVGATVLVVLRSRLKQDLETFILRQQHDEAAKRLIENQITLMDQLRAFLPKVLFTRVDRLIRMHRNTPVQAVAEVTKPRKTLAAVLFSDIRGFTGLTKHGDDAVISVILPAQRACTEAVEQFGGVPKIQGDLVFSYFDEEDPVITFCNALRAAQTIYRASDHLNNQIADGQLKIKRYAILSFGKAVVGNIGGTEGSMEITVIGNIANIAARVDELTKNDSIAAKLGDTYHPVILTAEAKNFLMSLYQGLEITELSLVAFDVSIRDFPYEKSIYLLPSTEVNQRIIQKNPDLNSGKIYIGSCYGQD